MRFTETERKQHPQARLIPQSLLDDERFFNRELSELELALMQLDHEEALINYLQSNDLSSLDSRQRKCAWLAILLSHPDLDPTQLAIPTQLGLSDQDIFEVASALKANELRILVNLYDIDGCIYYPPPGVYDVFFDFSDQMETWLIQHNQEFLDAQIMQIRREQYHKVIVAYGTMRQDWGTDYVNAIRGGGSCAPVLPILQSFFDRQVEGEVVLDPFLMADIYSQSQDADGNYQSKTAGESYEGILKTLYCKSPREDHVRWVFDHSKISIIYAHAHRVATFHPEAKIVIQFYDDHDDKRKMVFDFFSHHPDMLPKNVILRVIKYDGTPDNSRMPDIQGTGAIDSKYEWTVRYLAHLYSKDRKLNNIASAAELLERHHKNMYSYAASMHIELQTRHSTFTIQQVKDFRDREIATLPSDERITTIPNYTTRSALFSRRLIPERFITEPKPGLWSQFKSRFVQLLVRESAAEQIFPVRSEVMTTLARTVHESPRVVSNDTTEEPIRNSPQIATDSASSPTVQNSSIPQTIAEVRLNYFRETSTIYQRSGHLLLFKSYDRNVQHVSGTENTDARQSSAEIYLALD